MLANSPTASSPLRVGILVNSLTVRRWVRQVIEDIQSSDFAKIELVVLNGSGQADSPNQSFVERVRDAYRSGLFYRFQVMDQTIYRRRFRHDAMEQVDVSDLLSETPTRTCRPVETKYRDRFEQDDVEFVKAHQLDVLLRFGFRILTGEILESAKHGVWSYHHGDNREYRGGPALFWEIFERNPVSGAVLQVLTNELDGGKVIYRSLARTEFNSLFANRNPIYWKAAKFIPRRLKHLHAFGGEFLHKLETYRETIEYEKPIYRAPNGLQLLSFLGRRFLAGLRMQSRRLLLPNRDHRWFCAIRKANCASWTIIPNREDGFYADPFLLEKDGRTYLFVEEFRYDRPNATIVSCEVLDDGSLSEFQPALEDDVHLSYPHVFEHAGEIYMTPETAGAREVRLYRATSFPNEWQQVGTLLSDVVAVDPTIHEQDGRFYLFCNIAVPGSSCDDELHLFLAEKLEGPYRPHPLNPVVSNVLSSRPAGRLFERNGQLFRPAQDCSKRYGYAMTINRVIELSESAYKEVATEIIPPDWAPRMIGTHTVNRSSKFEVRDGQEWRWRWWQRKRV